MKTKNPNTHRKKKKSLTAISGVIHKVSFPSILKSDNLGALNSFSFCIYKAKLLLLRLPAWPLELQACKHHLWEVTFIHFASEPIALPAGDREGWARTTEMERCGMNEQRGKWENREKGVEEREQKQPWRNLTENASTTWSPGRYGYLGGGCGGRDDGGGAREEATLPLVCSQALAGSFPRAATCPECHKENLVLLELPGPAGVKPLSCPSEWEMWKVLQGYMLLEFMHSLLSPLHPPSAVYPSELSRDTNPTAAPAPQQGWDGCLGLRGGLTPITGSTPQSQGVAKGGQRFRHWFTSSLATRTLTHPSLPSLPCQVGGFACFQLFLDASFSPDLDFFWFWVSDM